MAGAACRNRASIEAFPELRYIPPMRTTLSPEDFQRSVIAVPPLCRDATGAVSATENQRLIRHLEAGGIRLLLYGGNANFYNLRPSEFARTLDILETAAGPETVVIPSVGPYYGTMMDQADLLAERRFPTVMVLPTVAVSSPEGVRTAILRFVERFGRPVVLYIKEEKYVTVDVARSLFDAGALSWIKYAVVRNDPSADPLLEALCHCIDPKFIVSGIGEQPAVVHLPKFRLGGFTSGCVCIAPTLSMDLLRALAAGNSVQADLIRSRFHPLESLRNQHGPIPVLHEAVAQTGIADPGPIQPLLCPPNEMVRTEIATAVKALFVAEQQARAV